VIFWIVTQFSLVSGYERFGGNSRLHPRERCTDAGGNDFLNGTNEEKEKSMYQKSQKRRGNGISKKERSALNTNLGVLTA
jgi:hypothetical protein